MSGIVAKRQMRMGAGETRRPDASLTSGREADVILQLTLCKPEKDRGVDVSLRA